MQDLGDLVVGVRAGAGRALVIRGEAGVGKTALLEHLLERASGCQVARAAGVESEMELPFAALHQLCAPMLDHLDQLKVFAKLQIRSRSDLDRVLARNAEEQVLLSR